MTKSVLIAFIIPVILLSSCENILYSQGKTDETLTQDKQILFFSDSNNIDREAIYYDALLDLKKEFPEEFEHLKVISEKSNENQYEVEVYPTLLLVEKEEIIVQIEGAVLTKHEIMEPMTDALKQ